MQRHLRVLIASACVFVSPWASADTFWPGYMGQQEAGTSRSSVKAPVPTEPIVKPAAEILSTQARWSGIWSGWMSRNAAIDVNVAVAEIGAEKVSLVYAVASPKIAPTATAVEARFVGDELHAALPSGGFIAMRMVAPERVEISYDGSKVSGGSCCTFGVLSKKP